MSKCYICDAYDASNIRMAGLVDAKFCDACYYKLQRREFDIEVLDSIANEHTIHRNVLTHAIHNPAASDMDIKRLTEALNTWERAADARIFEMLDKIRASMGGVKKADDGWCEGAPNE